MRIMLYILSVLFILNAAFINKDVRNKSLVRWVVEKNSSLNIQGETNINSFQCDVTEYLKADTLVYSTNDAIKKLTFTNSSLVVDVKRFDCHNKFISDDFRNALKADENPTLKIVFLYIDQFPNSCNDQPVKGIVDIELAHSVKRA